MTSRSWGATTSSVTPKPSWSPVEPERPLHIRDGHRDVVDTGEVVAVRHGVPPNLVTCSLVTCSLGACLECSSADVSTSKLYSPMAVVHEHFAALAGGACPPSVPPRGEGGRTGTGAHEGHEGAPLREGWILASRSRPRGAPRRSVLGGGMIHQRRRRSGRRILKADREGRVAARPRGREESPSSTGQGCWVTPRRGDPTD